MSLVIQSNTRALTFTSLANLRLLSGIQVSDDSVVFLTGHTTEDDNGGGEFYWDSTSTATDDNGVTVKLADTTTGRFIRSNQFLITAEMFGAVGNGVADDAPKINAAIQFVKLAGNARIVYFEGKNYGIGAQIIMETGVRLIGVGRQGTKLIGLAALGTSTMVSVSDTTGTTDYFRIGIEHMWLDKGASSALLGIDFVNLRNGRFIEYFLDGFTTGARLRGKSYYNYHEHCETDQCTTGFLCFPAGGFGANENHYYSCRTNRGVDGFAIQTDGSANMNGNKFVNCIVEAHSGMAFKLAGSGGLKVTNTQIISPRIDSSVGGAKSIEILDVDVVNTLIEDDALDGGVSEINNLGTTTQFRGARHEKKVNLVFDYGSISANSQIATSVTIAGVVAGKWAAYASPGGAGFADGLILEARADTTNAVRLIAHNLTGSPIDPANQTYTIYANRMDF